MHVHATHQPAPPSSGRALPSGRGEERALESDIDKSPLRKVSAGPPPSPPPAAQASPPGRSQPPIQLLSIPGAFDSAIRKIPKVDKGLDKLNANPRAKKAAKVASFLGFKIPFINRPKPDDNGGGEKSDCCKPTHPENRHDASKHDPEANKAAETPASDDQTVAPSAADPDKGTDPTPPEPPAVEKKATDSDKSKKWSPARKIFESTAAPQRTVASIRDRTEARFAASGLHRSSRHGPAENDEAAGSGEPLKVAVKDRVRLEKQKRVAAALSGEAAPAKARSPMSQAVKGQLDAAGVSRRSIVAGAQKDMAGTQAARFDLHQDAAKGRAEFKRPQQEAARHQALAGLGEAFGSPAAD